MMPEVLFPASCNVPPQRREYVGELVRRVLQRTSQYLRDAGVAGNGPVFEGWMQRAISAVCCDFVGRCIRESTRGSTSVMSYWTEGRDAVEDAAQVFEELKPVLDDVVEGFRNAYEGTILSIEPGGKGALKKLGRVHVRDSELDTEVVVPGVIFHDGFQEGDYFEKAAGEVFARRYEMTAKAIDEDWDLLWSRLSDADFCGRNWGKYIAVFGREVVGAGATDAEARATALSVLRERGTADVPAGRLVVDYVGNM